MLRKFPESFYFPKGSLVLLKRPLEVLETAQSKIKEIWGFCWEVEGHVERLVEVIQDFLMATPGPRQSWKQRGRGLRRCQDTSGCGTGFSEIFGRLKCSLIISDASSSRFL